MEEDSASSLRIPKDTDLNSVAVLVDRQVKLEQDLANLEDLLKQTSKELSQVKDIDLPNALERFGLSELRLLDGSIVVIKEDVHAGITVENRDKAFDWLTVTGNDGIIKNEVKLPFGKGQESEAQGVMTLLDEKGISYTNSKTVHPQTLKAFVKRRLEDGEPIPTDIFSIHITKSATIKSPKKK
jgi:hypothetical protein